MTLITMTTVGYGELKLKTIPGRVIGMFSCLLGMVLVSLCILSLSTMTEFSKEEQKAFDILKKMKCTDKLERNAGRIIRALFKMKRYQKKYTFKGRIEWLKNLSIHIKKLRNQKRYT
jgi:hypothetical protein